MFFSFKKSLHIADGIGAEMENTRGVGLASYFP